MTPTFSRAGCCGAGWSRGPPGPRSEVIGRRVPGLVEPELAATGKGDRGHQPEPGLAHPGAELRSLGPELGHRLLKVIAHQVELVLAGSAWLLAGRVTGQFRRRLPDKQPAD